MNARLVISHLAVGLLGLVLGLAATGGIPGLRRPIGDPVAALGEAAAIDDPQARTRALLDFFAAADPAWATDLRDAVNTVESQIFLDEVGETLFAGWWAKADPKAAFDRRIDPAWPNRHPWLRETMRAWVKRAPTDAAAAAGTLPPNPDRGKVEVARVLVEHWWDDPNNDDAAPILVVINALDLRTRASAIVRLLQKSIEKRGIPSTEELVESIPETDDLAFDVRQEMFSRYVQLLAERDAEEAVRFAKEHEHDREGLGVMRHLAFTWGGKDGPAAMRWAVNLPDRASRNRILLRAWLSFRHAQPDAAAEWLAQQEPSDALITIYRRYLTGTAGVDPQKALALAEKAKDPAMREQLLTAVGVGWMKSDPKAATEWLDTVELAPELEAEVRAGIETVDPDEQFELDSRG